MGTNTGVRKSAKPLPCGPLVLVKLVENLSSVQCFLEVIESRTGSKHGNLPSAFYCLAVSSAKVTMLHWCVLLIPTRIFHTLIISLM
jgi:hypothetical protein